MSEAVPGEECAQPPPGKRCPKGCRRDKKSGTCQRRATKAKVAKENVGAAKLKVQPGVAIARPASAPSYLYPTLDSPTFSAEIARRKEFYDTRYEGGVKDVAAEAERLCNAGFEVAPHQMFVRNFLSLQTPYNGLLLYHGLGSGKTCTGIGVAEEMRDYLRQTGAGTANDKIIVVAAPNVQDNFRAQLFDPGKMKETAPGSKLWTMRSCTGSKYLKEVNPLATARLSKEKVVKEVQLLIRASYRFYGYEKFANLVSAMMDGIEADTPSGHRKRAALRAWAKNRLIIIDEAHNLSSSETKTKAVSRAMERLVAAAPGMRLLLLSATPAYHDPQEILWLLNLLRVNDSRARIRTRDVFLPDGSFQDTSEPGKRLTGARLLESRATGYVSFVRGENPYTFPYRIWPSQFARGNTFAVAPRPRVQVDDQPVSKALEKLDVYLVPITGFQAQAYDYAVTRMEDAGLNYTVLQTPLQCLNMTYPLSGEPLVQDGSTQPLELVSSRGLKRAMQFDTVGSASANQYVPGSFSYRPGYPAIFSADLLPDHGAKVAAVVKAARTAEGVVLVHSEYIAGGVVPLALALEEAGFARAGRAKSLFRTPPGPPLGYRGGTTSSGEAQAKYTIISGDAALSPDNAKEVRLLTQPSNADGASAKVVIISQAGAEGLDLKFVRQVHILEPWYNMSRIEQIIGRAVRTCSHRALPFPRRNVQIFLYASLLPETEVEAVDVYVYRQAESRATRTGAVSRLLKKASVDCLLNIEQMGFTVEDMDQTVLQRLGDGQEIQYQVGDRPFTAACDYMDSCKYSCSPVASLGGRMDDGKPSMDTFSETSALMNTDKVVQRIRDVFSEHYFARKPDLVRMVQVQRNYPVSLINAALTLLTTDRSERLRDKYGRTGHLVNVGDMYFFQPAELEGTRLTVGERSHPLDFKREAIVLRGSPAGVNGKGASRPGRASRKATDELEMLALQLGSLFGEAEGEGKGGAGKDLGRHTTGMRKAMDVLAEQGVSVEELAKVVESSLIERLPVDRLKTLLEQSSNERVAGSGAERARAAEGVRAWTRRNLIGGSGGAPAAIPAFSLEGGVDSFRLLVKRAAGSGWALARPEDIEDLKPAVESQRGTVLPADARLGSPMGFLYPFKSELVVFKVKDMYQPGKTGARCDQGGPTQAKTRMAELMVEKGFPPGTGLGRDQLCAHQELVLRVLTQRGEDDRTWFVPAPLALLAKVPKTSYGN